MQRYFLKKLQVSKLRELLQRVRIAVRPAFVMEDSEAPKSKRPRVDDTKQGETEAAGAPDGKQGGPRFAKRRKCILLMAYNGKGYLGMQKNPGVLTIEEDLLDALTKAGAFPEEMKDNLGKLQFQRCARTDKEVSAARQVVSIKINQVLLPRVNSFLPEKIRIIALKRVTKSFDSRHSCSARTYEYLLPTYAYAPFRLTNLGYRIDDQTVAKVSDLLGQYVGTHNFHNFTSGTKFEQMASNRFIMSFECGRPFLAHSTCSTCQEKKEVEFMTLKVKGQSFMIHQIRKMIGLVIAIVRGRTQEDTLQKAYGKEKVDIPRAPGLGLLLENVHFERYNVRISGDGIHELLDWTPFDEEVEKFKREKIHQSIIDTEIDEMSMSQWLGSLQIHDFNQTAMRLKLKEQLQDLESTSPNVGEEKMEQAATPAISDEKMAESAKPDVSDGQCHSTTTILKVEEGEGERERENLVEESKCVENSAVTTSSASDEAKGEQATVVTLEPKSTLPDSVVSERSTVDAIDCIEQTDNYQHDTDIVKITNDKNCLQSN